MPIKIYFGPYKHSPVPPISGGEATLTIPEFHLLRGYDRDFWTANPFVLDVFDPQQIFVWYGSWIALPEALALVAPEVEAMRRNRPMPPGKAALMVEVFRVVEQQCEDQGATEAQAEKVLEDIKRALVH